MVNRQDVERLHIGNILERPDIKLRFRVTIPLRNKDCEECGVRKSNKSKMLRLETGNGRLIRMECIDCYVDIHNYHVEKAKKLIRNINEKPIPLFL